LNESSSNLNCNNAIRGGGTDEAGSFSLKMRKTHQNSASPAIKKLTNQLIQEEADELCYLDTDSIPVGLPQKLV